MLSPPGGHGILKTSSLLVYETVQQFDLDVVAYDLGSPMLSSMTVVKVTVMNDVNLFPSFEEEIQERAITSSTAVHSIVFICSAGSGNYKYSIIG